MERKGIKWRTLQSSWSAYTWILFFLAYPPQEGTNWNQALKEAKNFPPHHTNLPTPPRNVFTFFCHQFSCTLLQIWLEGVTEKCTASIAYCGSQRQTEFSTLFMNSLLREMFSLSFATSFPIPSCRHDWKEVLEMQGQHSLLWLTKAQWMLNFV